MNKRSKKLITWSIVVCMILTQMLFANVAFAATYKEAGADRYETALKVVKAGWTSSDNAVIARGDDIADALAAAPLAYAKGKAPILLTETNALPAGVLAELTALGVKNVYIVGGTGAVSTAVESQLAGFNVKRLYGADRYATSLAIAKEAFPTAPAKAVMVNGEAVADALSISSIAANLGMPILLVGKDEMTTEVGAYLTGKDVYAVGGTGVISDTVASNATRLYGNDRYATNVAVLKAFTLNYANVFIAVGEDANAVDALGGASFAALNNNPIFLVNTALTADASALLKANLTLTSNIYVLGGVVPASVVSAIEALVPVVTDLHVESVSAINAKTVEIKFNAPVDETTVVSGTDKLLNISFTAIGTAAVVDSANAAASLSDDGKVLTVTAKTTEYFKGSYAVTVNTSVLDENDDAIVAYSEIKDLTDSVRPTASVSYPVNKTARVTFSEPINVGSLVDASTTKDDAIYSALSIKDADAAAVATTNLITAVSADNKSFDLDISGFVADKTYTITLVGLADFAGKLISPNPVTLNVVNSTVDNVKPTVTAIEALDVKKVKITFSEKLGVLGTVNTEAIDITAGTGNATVDDSGLVYTVTTKTAVLNGVTVVTLAGFVDLSTNAGDAYTKTLNFVTDSTVPTFVSSEVKADGADQYLYIKYSENVVLGAPTNALTGSYVNSSSVTLPMTAIAVADASLVLATGATTTDTIKIKITGLTAGTYTVATDKDLVADLAVPTANKAASKTITFAFGTYSDPTVPTAAITSVQATEDKVVVTYSLDVTAATALNLANYTVEGQQVFASAIFKGAANIVELTLNPNVITITGNRMLTVKNVTTAAGKVMADYTTTQNFKENIKPYLVSAKVTSATAITATFSENVTGSTNAFEVYVDGTKLTSGVSAAAGAGTKTVVITIPTITDLTKTYTIKFVGTDFVDGTTPANKSVTGTIVTVAY